MNGNARLLRYGVAKRLNTGMKTFIQFLNESPDGPVAPQKAGMSPPARTEWLTTPETLRLRTGKRACQITGGKWGALASSSGWKPSNLPKFEDCSG